jgi:hypothetical protein
VSKPKKKGKGKRQVIRISGYQGGGDQEGRESGGIEDLNIRRKASP